MSEAVKPRQSYAPAEPGLIDEVERRLILLGGKHRERGGDLEGFPVRHTFTPGLYVRELTIPAGGICTSEIHKLEHPYVVSSGCLTVYGEDIEPVTIRAPYQGITMPGTRRVGFAHEDTVWTTFHVTDKTDLVSIESDIYEDYTNPLLGPALDQKSYIDFMLKFGFKETDVRRITEATDDQVSWDDQRTEVRPSSIQGLGLFAKKRILKGELFVGRTKDLERTPAGRYTNHAEKPNCVVYSDGDALIMVACTDLEIGTELTIDYVSTLQVNLQVITGEVTR